MKKNVLILLLLIAQTAYAQQWLPEHKLLRRITPRSERIQPAPPQRPDFTPTQQPSAIRPATKTATVTPGKYDKSARLLPSYVAPLLSSQWDQEGALRKMTPLIDGQHAPVGCVALAMAQVMHYWQYPIHGIGSLTYTDSLGCGQTLYADFSTHYYEWDKMLDIYKDGLYTDEQANAGALLCSDCGISVRTQYGIDASGAEVIMQAVAMPQYFGYDESTQIYFRDFYTKSEITQMLKTELADGRPVLTTGYNYNGGHAFVIDGYDENDWFHINLGNPDAPDDGDGWTPLENLSPDSPRWTTPDSPESGLNILQIFVLGVIPTNKPSATRQENHIFAMDRMEAIDTARYDTDIPMQICVHDLANIGRNLHNDSVSIMLTRNDSIIAPLYTYDRHFMLEELDDTTYTDTISILLPADLDNGKYKIQPMYRDGGTWTQVRTCTGTPNYLLLDADSDRRTLQSDTANTAYLTLEDLVIPDLIINGTAPEINLTLKNHNAEISGRIFLLMEPIDDIRKPFFLVRQGIYMQKDEVSTRMFSKTKIYAPKTGTYRLRVLYSNSLFTDTLTELTTEYIEVSVLHASTIQIAER